MFVPQGQVPDAINALNVRHHADGMGHCARAANLMPSAAAIQEQLRQVTGLPVSDVRSMNEVVSRSMSRQRFNMLLMTSSAARRCCWRRSAFTGLMAYSVQQRTQEIGIRMALGAGSADVRRMVVVQGMRLALVGVVAGLASSFGLTRVIASFLFGVQARDPMVFVGIPILLGLVALAAVWIPARRASVVSPVVALRYE